MIKSFFAAYSIRSSNSDKFKDLKTGGSSIYAGFKQLISVMYPILGYIGILLLLTLLIAWVREKQNIYKEKMIRRKMISVASKKYDENQEYTKKDAFTRTY